MPLSQNGANYEGRDGIANPPSSLREFAKQALKATDDLASQLQAVRAQGNFGQAGNPLPPHPVTALSVKADAGFASIALTHNNAPPGSSYMVEMSTTPNFTAETTTRIDNGESLTTPPIAVASQPVYFRAAAKTLASPISEWTYLGSQNSPTPVSSALPTPTIPPTFLLPPGGPWRIQWGGPVGAGATVFPIAFSGTPVVALGNINGSVDINAGSITSTGFSLAVTPGSTAGWIAVGPA